MKLKKVLQDIEYTPKQVLGYYIEAFKIVKKQDDISIENYIKILIDRIEKVDKKDILKKIDMNIIADFPFYYNINNEEMLCYAIIIFDALLKYREFKPKDITSELEIAMKFYSARTVMDKANEILEEMQKSNVRN